MEPTARIFRSSISFDVTAQAGHRVLTDATDRAQDAARDALPATGTVRAEGALGSARDGRRRVQVRLTVSGADATLAWTPAAEDAFARAFVDALEAKGYEAERSA